MITGSHAIIYTKDAEADRAFFRDVLGFKKYINHGDGWLIFALPPLEVGFHPHHENNLHELYFMCKDIKKTIDDLKAKGVKCTEINDQPWGLLTMITLPGGGEIGLYQPKHETAIEM